MQVFSRRSFLARFGVSLSGAIGLGVFAGTTAKAATGLKVSMHVYKSPWCGCCGAWIDHMRDAGLDVRVTEVEDLAPVKARYGVPQELQSCHTGIIEDYVIEGHVPAPDVARLLKERPEATGLSVPGMPVGSPGMEQGARRDPYEVVLFSPSKRSVYARYPGRTR
ncbi:MAG: DUF411 domain-containing protein [Alphaproteobacteria bacterium]|nr:DUF411 domain-containing protein [Alphaproteobacteria bacterium]